MTPPVRVREAAGDELAGWDARLARFPNARVVHTRAWIDSLVDCGFGTPLYLLFESGGEVVGCLPGLLRRVGPWRLFGSPLAGWQTVSLGPAFDRSRVTTAELIGPLVEHLERRHGVAHVELMHRDLDPAAMRALGFAGEPVATYRAPLYPGDQDRVFKAMKDSARRNIRRAGRLGLALRFHERDAGEAFVDEHYDQAAAVYRRRGTAIPFSRDRVRQCFRRMREAGCLLAPAVYLPDGTCIASGMFFLGCGELLLWSWAHRDRYRWYRGTELMTWTVMQRAMDAGCTSFDLMGRGDFKARLGAELDFSKWRWMRSRPRWLALARRVAEAGYRSQQAVRGRVSRLVARVAAGGRSWEQPPVPATPAGEGVA